MSVANFNADDMAMKLQKEANQSSHETFRMRVALVILREWTLGNNYNASVLIALRNWIDRGMEGPVPWPGGAFFEEWAEKQGFVNIDGFVGIKASTKIFQKAPTTESSEDIAITEAAISLLETAGASPKYQA